MIVEIEGHLIDAGKISYISPIEAYIGGPSNFCIVVDGVLIPLEFEGEETAVRAREKCARESGVSGNSLKPKWRPR